MKKILLTLAGFVVTLLSIAQSPNLMNYQGVARNAAGNVLPNQPIGLKLTILTGTPTGAVVYSETRNVTTNAFGLFNVVVGSPGAITTTGSIAGINWTAFGAGSGSKFLQVEIDPVGGTSYVNVGSTQLVSVPYALNAGAAAPVGPAGGDLTGTYPNPTVARLQGRAVSAAAPANKNLLMWDAGTVSWIPATAAQAGVVSGTGTLNMVAKWTPDAVTIGNSKIFDDGNFVGIGTTTPGAGLVVSGNGIWNSAIGIQNTGTGMEWRMNVSGNTFGITKVPGSTFTPLQLFSTGGMDFSNSAGTSIARLLDNGDVGIGTVTPVDKFHVVKGNSGMLLGGGANTGSEAKFLSFGTSHISIYNRGNNALTFAQTSSLSQTNTLGSELMALTTAGNLGIGTVAPTARVHATAASGVSILGENSGSGDAVAGINTGTGRGGYFEVNNPASTADGLRGVTNGTGASWGVRGISSGTNGAGLFQQTNAANTSNNLQSNQAGLGRAGLFNATNAASTANAVDINVAGTGFALRAASSNATPKALLTVGGVQHTGIGEAANRVLVSDAAGNATWNTLGSVGGVSGSGTLNFIPKWTPDGATIGNSQLFDNGTNVGLGTITPAARLQVTNANASVSAQVDQTNATNINNAMFINNANATSGPTGASLQGGAGLYVRKGTGSTLAFSNPSAVISSINTDDGVGILGLSDGANSFAVAGVTIGNGGTAVLGQAESPGSIGLYGVSLGGATSRALLTDGNLQLTNIGEAVGRVLTSDATGNATWQSNAISISLRNMIGNPSIPSAVFTPITQWQTILNEDGGANYNNVTGEYTITVSGNYHINASVFYFGFGAAATSLSAYVNGVFDYNTWTPSSPSQFANVVSYERRLNAGDRVSFYAFQNSGSTQSIAGGVNTNSFSIHLIHR